MGVQAEWISLTKKEYEVLSVFLEIGGTNKQIGDRLHNSEDTIKSHMKALLIKTGCSSRTQLAVLTLKGYLRLYPRKEGKDSWKSLFLAQLQQELIDSAQFIPTEGAPHVCCLSASPARIVRPAASGAPEASSSLGVGARVCPAPAGRLCGDHGLRNDRCRVVLAGSPLDAPTAD